jgi:predicted kinase
VICAAAAASSLRDNASMGFLLLITGPPGAGKSTIARALAAEFDPSVLVEGDAFFGFLARGAIPPWLPDSQVQNDVVVRAQATATGCFVAGGYATVFDGVIGPWYIAHFAAQAGLDELHYAILLPPPERCVAQVRGRTGHNFADEDATLHMHKEFAQAEVGARHVLADVPATAAQTAAEVLRRFRAGALRYP